MESFGSSGAFLLLESAILLGCGDQIQALAFGPERRDPRPASPELPGWLRLGERLHLALSAAVFLGTGLVLLLGLADLLRRRNVLALSLAALGVLVFLRRRHGGEALARVFFRGGRGERCALLGLVALLGGLSVVLGPGYPMVLGDRDPGVYVNTAASAWRTHGFLEHDDWAEQVPAEVYEESFGLPNRNRDDLELQAFHGVYRRGGRGGQTTLVPEFPLLYPSALALFGLLFGFDGMFYLGPFLTALALVGLLLLLRHFVPAGAALGGALLFGTSYATIFYARYPMPETLCQIAYIAAILALHRAALEKRGSMEVWAGAAAGLIPLARLDGIVLSAVTLLVHAGLIASGAGRRLRRFAVPFYALSLLAVVLLRTLHWSYLEGSLHSMLGRGPGRSLLTVFDLGAKLAVLLAGAWIAGRIAVGLAPRRRQALACLLPCALGVLGLWARYLRPLGSAPGQSWTAVMLEWYLYPGVFTVAALGLAVAASQSRHRPVSGLAFAWALGLAAFHLGDPYVDADHPWWARRVFWHLLPALCFLSAVALGSGGARWLRRAGASVLVALALVQLGRSWPMLGDRPFALVPADVQRLIGTLPSTGWVLVDDARWALPLSRIGGRRVAFLRHGTPELAKAVVEMLRNGKEVFLVCDNPQNHSGWMAPPLAVGTVADFLFPGWPGHPPPPRQLPRLPFENKIEQRVAVRRLFLFEPGPGGELPPEAFESDRAALQKLDGQGVWQMAAEAQGFILYGPRVTLAPGRYRAAVRLEAVEGRAPPRGWADVAADYGQRQLVASSLLWTGTSASAELPFTLQDVGRAVEIRVFLSEPGQVRIGPLELHVPAQTP